MAGRPRIDPEAEWSPLQLFPGSEITDDEREFGKAVDAYRRKHGRLPVRCSEWLACARAAGFVKAPTAPAQPPEA